MNVNELVRRLESIRDDLKEKDVVIEAENGMLLPPEIKFKLKKTGDVLNFSNENVEYILIKW